VGPTTRAVAEPRGMAEHDDNRTDADQPERRERPESERREPQNDRRAFWRPTPDRRREATERGRRKSDVPPT